MHARITIDAHTGQMADMESKVEIARLQRDQAVADRAKYEAFMLMLQAQLHAFDPPATPLIRTIPDDERSEHSGAH